MKNFLLRFLFIILIFNCSKSYSFQIKWVIDGLNEPESAVYDKNTNAIYVSSINGDPLQLDKNGYISKISVNGQILEKKWISGLDAPKGLAVFKKFLYVSDVNKVWKISLEDKKKNFFPLMIQGSLMI